MTRLSDIPALQLLFPHLKYNETIDGFNRSSYPTLEQAMLSHVPSVNSESIVQVLKDQPIVLYLFQCFQEAQDTKLCEVLSKII